MMGITCKWSAARDCSECDEPICLRELHSRDKDEGGEAFAEPDH